MYCVEIFETEVLTKPRRANFERLRKLSMVNFDVVSTEFFVGLFMKAIVETYDRFVV